MRAVEEDILELRRLQSNAVDVVRTNREPDGLHFRALFSLPQSPSFIFTHRGLFVVDGYVLSSSD